MKKLKKIKILLFGFILTLSFCFINTNVYAKTTTPNEIQGPAYVIGSHVFTREVNETTGYQGRLTTNLIMLASQTIASSDLDNMIIYYKTATGMWINGLTGNLIETPESFEINYTNMQLEEVNNTVSAPKAPILSLHGGALSIDEETDIMSYQLSIYIDDIEDKTNKVDGVELTIKDYNSQISYKDLEYDNFAGHITTILSNTTDDALEIGKQYHIDYFHFENTPNGYYKISAKAYVKDANGKKTYSDSVYIEMTPDTTFPSVEIVNDYSNPDYISENENYHTYKLRIKKPDAYVFKSNEEKFAYVVFRTGGTSSQVGIFGLNEIFTIEIAKESVETLYARLGYYDKNGDFKLLNTQSSDENRKNFIIDTRKTITTPVLELDQREENYDHNRTYGDQIEADYTVYSNADEDTLDYSVKGVEIYKIYYDGINMSNFQYIAPLFNIKDSFFVQVKPENGMATYVGRAYATNTVGQKIYSEYSNVVTVIRTPEIEASDISERKVMVSIKNIEEYGTAFDLKYKVFNNEGIALTNLVNLNEASSVNVDRATKEIYIRIYKVSDKTETTYSAKSNKIKIDINEDLISYNLNDGNIKDKNNIETYNDASLPYTLINPEREGYAFVGWTGSNGTLPQKSVTIKEGTIGNLEYTANWLLLGDINTDGDINDKDTILIKKYLSNLEELTETQQLIADLNQDNDVDDIDVSIMRNFLVGNITLPYDSGTKYSIKYELKEGIIDDERNIETYAEISLPHTLKNPEKEGYSFVGWTGSNGIIPQKSVTIEAGTTGNLEYIANWISQDDIPIAPTISNTYSEWINDGTLEGVIDICEVGEYDYQNKPVGAELYIKTMDGYTLVEEIQDDCLLSYTINPGQSNIYTVRTYINYNSLIRVYSNYSNELLIKNENIITYNLNGGINSDNNPIGYSSNRQYDLVLEEPTKEGYVFLGWTGSNGDTPQKSVTIESGTTGNLEYIANWQLNDEDAIDNTIPLTPIISNTYSEWINDGTLEGVIDICEVGEYNYQNKPVGAELYIKTMDSYTLVEEIQDDCLLSYTINPGQSNIYVARVYTLDSKENKIYSNYSNELLIKNPNTITYDLNGGINSINNPISYSGKRTYNNLLEEPTKEGYVFLGWTGSNGDTPQKSITIEAGTTGNLEYIANWEKTE